MKQMTPEGEQTKCVFYKNKLVAAVSLDDPTMIHLWDEDLVKRFGHNTIKAIQEPVVDMLQLGFLSIFKILWWRVVVDREEGIPIMFVKKNEERGGYNLETSIQMMDRWINNTLYE